MREKMKKGNSPRRHGGTEGRERKRSGERKKNGSGNGYGNGKELRD
jgi:hypothetical protein